MCDKDYREFIDSIRYRKENDLRILNDKGPSSFSKYKHASWLHLMGLMETTDLINGRYSTL